MIRQLVTLLTLALVALPAAAQSTRTTTFVYTDHLGSPIMLVEAGTRNVVWQAQYGPFGAVVAESGTPADRPGYTGHYRDVPTGLVYMQQRYYDPAAGRFLSVDPVTPSLQDGSNFNRYWYANNNPYLYVDPNGEAAVFGFVAGVGLEVTRQIITGEIKDASASGIAQNVGKAAVAGLSGAAGVGLASNFTRLSVTARAAANGGTGAGIGATSRVTVNVIEGNDLGDGVATSAAIGGVFGAAGSLVGDAFTNPAQRLANTSGNFIGTTDGQVAAPAAANAVGFADALGVAVSNSPGVVDAIKGATSSSGREDRDR